jgi:lipopolysaccharide transport system permease protein
MIAPIRQLWRYRRILRTTALNDLRARYRGTAFGLVWVVLYPLLFLGLYGTVYSRILRVQVVGFGTLEYLQIIFCGLVPFIGFSEALSSGVSSVTGNRGLIRNTMFPIELIPVKVVLTSSFSLTVSLAMLMVFLWGQGTVHLTQLALPLIVFLQIVFSIGVVWILSSLCVFLPDIAQVIGIVILFLMIISPIAYTREMVPSNLRAFLLPNPLYYLIMLYRDAAFTGVISEKLLLAFSAVTAFTFVIGWTLFSRLKPLFSDYV